MLFAAAVFYCTKGNNMKQIVVGDTLRLSRIIHGHWRLHDWNYDEKGLQSFINDLIDRGITTFDHADIYGDYSCEQLFGEAILKHNAGLRKNIQLVTKCGIVLPSKKFPSHKVHRYDYSYEHIIASVERSLVNLHTDYIDLLLLHRPAPFFDPVEVARAFDRLAADGKVRYFGVSNFNPGQFDMLNRYCSEALVTNQIEISPYCLEHFENGNIDFCLKEVIKPMAWSPLAGGRFIDPQTDREKEINQALALVADELDIDGVDKIMYAWLLNHPAQIMPIVGSGKMERIQSAIDALDIELNLDQWYAIYKAALETDLP